MANKLDFLIDDDGTRSQGISYPTVISAIIHVILIVLLVRAYRPVSKDDVAPPIAHFVQLIKQNPRDFTEAPGRKVDKAPLQAPLSDANRRAAMPHPTGDQPTLRPGDGSGQLYVPRNDPGDGRRPSPAVPEQRGSFAELQRPQQQQQQAQASVLPQQESNSSLTFRQQQANANTAPVDLRSAIREVGKVASLGNGRNGADLGQLGGDKGWTANEGPISFESSWYDWGDYAEGMVSRIRVHWYANMPMPLLKAGMKGVVTIRFTIHRTGEITDVTIVNSSGIPPYDFAAKKAIELASPLAPLPADFPKDTEHVMAMFFYNMEPPQH